DATEPTQRRNLIMVAPDVLSEGPEGQRLSLELLREYAPQVRAWQDAGVSMMVPVHHGALSIADGVREARRIIGPDFVLGIPSKAKALSAEELSAALEDLKATGEAPRRIHLLGSGRGPEWEGRVQLVNRILGADLDELTSDATTLRSYAGRENVV